MCIYQPETGKMWGKYYWTTYWMQKEFPLQNWNYDTGSYSDGQQGMALQSIDRKQFRCKYVCYVSYI